MATLNREGLESNLKLCMTKLRDSPAKKCVDRIMACESFEVIMVCI